MAERPSQSAELALAEHAHTERLRRERPVLWAATLFGPFALTGIALLILWGVYGAAHVHKLVATAVATFFFLGRFVILGGSDPQLDEVRRFLTRGELFAMVVWMDLMVACVLVYHLGWLFRIPWLGPRVLALSEDGRFILRSHPWMRRLTLIGLILFVAAPIAATGSVGGAIFGRLLGLSRPMTMLGIALGSLLGCAAMYWGAGAISKHLGRDNPWSLVAGIGIILAIIAVLNHRYRKAKNRARARGEFSG